MTQHFSITAEQRDAVLKALNYIKLETEEQQKEHAQAYVILQSLTPAPVDAGLVEALDAATSALSVIEGGHHPLGKRMSASALRDHASYGLSVVEKKISHRKALIEAGGVK